MLLVEGLTTFADEAGQTLGLGRWQAPEGVSHVCPVRQKRVELAKATERWTCFPCHCLPL